MFTSPNRDSQIASLRRRDMLASAEQYRFGRQARTPARASRNTSLTRRILTLAVSAAAAVGIAAATAAPASAARMHDAALTVQHATPYYHYI
jgi:hypothetical protein